MQGNRSSDSKGRFWYLQLCDIRQVISPPWPSFSSSIKCPILRVVNKVWINWHLKKIFKNFFFQYWGLNSGPCACLAGAPSLELCPQPPLSTFLWDWDLNSGLCAYKADVLLLESHLQSVLFWRWGVTNYFPELVSNRDPPDLSFPSSFGLQVWATGTWITFNFFFFF
jgi:hypothetical protein